MPSICRSRRMSFSNSAISLHGVNLSASEDPSPDRSEEAQPPGFSGRLRVFEVPFQRSSSALASQRRRSIVSGVDAYNRDLVSGSDIIAERKIGLRQALSPKESAIRIPSDQIIEPATHHLAELI